MPDSKRKKILDAALKSLLAITDTQWYLKGPATFISELAPKFGDLPEKEKAVLADVGTEELRQALTRIGSASSHSAEAAAGVSRLEEKLNELVETIKDLAEPHTREDNRMPDHRTSHDASGADDADTVLLHLSDLHFGSIQNATNWHSQIADDLKAELSCSKIDVLVLSGDIADRSTPKEYEAAQRFIEALSNEFGITHQHIVVVPGNHDVNWSLSKRAYRPKRREDYRGRCQDDGTPDPNCAIDKGDFVEAQSPGLYTRRFKHFANFYQAIRGEPYPEDYDKQATLHHFPEHEMLILALNTSWQLDHFYTGRAGIHSGALSNALTQIRNDPGLSATCNKFAVWHHPMISQEEDRLQNLEFMQRLCQAGFSVAFHGHIHRADQAQYKYDMPFGGRRTNVICAGTFGAPTRQWVPGYPLQYNLLTITGRTLTVETRCRRERDGAWRPDAIWSQGPGQDPKPRYEIQLPAMRRIARRDQDDVVDPDVETKVDVVGKGGEAVPLLPNSVDGNRTILILASNPIGTQRLQLDQEVRDITQKLRAGKQGFVIEERWAVRIEDLKSALLEVEPDIVHFSGHGHGDGIYLEGDDGRPVLVSGEALADLFSILMDESGCLVQCLFFNACYSEAQARPISPSVAYVIGVKNEIGDADARVFALGFYEALASGLNYEQAFKLGRVSLKLKDMPVDSHPVILKSEAITDTRSRNWQPPTDMAGQRPPWRVLFLAANPRGTEELRLNEEYREIFGALSQAAHQGVVALTPRWGVRVEDLHDALLCEEPNIIHFSCHADESRLHLESPSGEIELLTSAHLGELIQSVDLRLACIILNMSFGDLHAKQLVRCAAHVIGAGKAIGDKEAIAFSRGFYRALASGRSISKCFDAGSVRSQIPAQSDTSNYCLLGAES